MRAAPNPIRIMVCDDDVRVRTTLSRILGSQHDFALVGSVGSGEEALTELRVSQPDVLLLDAHLPGTDGTEVARQIRAMGYTTAIVLFSADDRAARVIVDLDGCVFLPKGLSGARRVLAEMRAAASR